MQVTVERLPGSTVSLDIYADPDEFATAVDNAFRKIAREVNVPGFRRGKAPRQLIEQMIGREAVVEEAGRDMMDDLYRRAIEQEEVIPVGEPQVALLQLDPIGFKVIIEVFPTVTLGDYRSVRVEPREVTIEESEVEEVIEQLRKQHAEWTEPDPPRMPLEGDRITLDLDVYEGEEVFQDPTRDATFIIGETPLFDSIVEAIKMMMPGTTAELSLAFDEDDDSVDPKLRGKELRYVLTLKAVHERILPEVNDEFAQLVGPQYETAEALREAIEKDLLRNKALETRAEVVTEAINAMAETADVEIPNAMVEKEIDDEITQFRSRLAQQRMTLEEYLERNGQTEEELRAEIRPNAYRRVRNTVVLQQIAKAENLEVTDEDITAEIDRLSAGAENPERLRSLYSSDYFRGLLENELFDRKLTDRVIEIATDGVGAVTGPGAEALKAEFEPRPAPAASATADEDDEAAQVTEGDQLPLDVDAEVVTEASATAAADGEVVTETDASDVAEVEEQVANVAAGGGVMDTTGAASPAEDDAVEPADAETVPAEQA